MKKVILTAILALSLSSAQAGLWDELSSMTKKEVKTIAYTIDTSGTNIRVYEWETPTGKICTWVISSRRQDMHCDWKPE